MISEFCIRLAFGLLFCLVILLPFDLHPRFRRSQFLTALGFLVLCWAFLLLQGTMPWNDFLPYLFLGTTVLCALGSMTWLFEKAPGGNFFIIVGTLLTGFLVYYLSAHNGQAGLQIQLGALVSGLLLGSALSAMLLGHAYLIAPAMSIQPLKLLSGTLLLAFLLRMSIALWSLWILSQSGHLLSNTETTIWISARWIVGFIIPFVLSWMGWETVAIKSTQSATGILYVVVILCFLGELTGLLLEDQTGLSL